MIYIFEHYTSPCVCHVAPDE